MQRITLITIGSLKESYWKEAQEEYLKRLCAFARIEISVIPETPLRSPGERDAVQRDEAERILARIPEDARVIALDERGTQEPSPDFAKTLTKWTQHGEPLVFILGGPTGLHQSIRDRASATIALSAMTFTHQMARVFLLEQLYRAYMIARGQAYHY